MPAKCCVPLCTSGYVSNHEKVSLFKIPQEKVKEWQKLIARKDREITFKDFVCEKHFVEDDIVRELKAESYTIPLGKPKLSKNACPVIFPGYPKYLCKSLPTKRRQIQRTDVAQKKKKIEEPSSSTSLIEYPIEYDEISQKQGPFLSFFRDLWNNQVLKMPSRAWAMQYIDGTTENNHDDNSTVCILQSGITENDVVYCKKKITVSKSSVRFYVLGHLVEELVEDDLTKISDIQDLTKYVDKADSLLVCNGAASISDNNNTYISSMSRKDKRFNVWRHVQCSYVLNAKNKNMCNFCTKSKKAIRIFIQKREVGLPTLGNLTQKRYAMRRKRSQRLKVKNGKFFKELNVIRQRIRNLDKNDLFKKIDDLSQMSSIQKIMLKECVNACKYRKKTSRRYSSAWLLTCLLLHIKSPSAYRFLRNNNVIPLPAISTVRLYLSRVNLKCGVDEKFMEAFELKMKEKNKFERHGILIFDEMQVRKDISLNVKTMKLMGIQDFGSDNESTAKTTDGTADHALVFMFSSLAEKFSQPVAVYAAKNSTKGTCLAQLILAIIAKLEKAGAVIDGIVCDGATTNRKMWSIFGVSGKLEDTKFKIIHPEDETRNLFFFSDTPHLIKCVRNRFCNKKILFTPEGVIKWQHYQTLLELDMNNPNNLRVVPKLSEAHINPSNLLKMRVKLATQVFSNSVADGLKYYQTKSPLLSDVESTVKFTRRVNNLFDSLNRRFPSEGIRIDSRDFVNLGENLDWLNSWENMVSEDTIKEQQFLTRSTAEGLRVTILSTIELSRNLLTRYGFQYVLTNKMNQDPLEKFFGIIRQVGGANDHPTFVNFLQLYRMLSVYKLLKPPVFGNCTVLETDHIPPALLDFEAFKRIFSAEDDNKKTHVEKIKAKMDSILNDDEWDNETICENIGIIHDPSVTETTDCIIYYLTGFICKKLYNSSNCVECRKYLYHTAEVGQQVPASSLTTLKSRGWLNHPNVVMFNMFNEIENKIMLHIKSVDVFDATIEDLFSSNLNISVPFPCIMHKEKVISSSIYFYITMRIKQFYKQESQKVKKASSEKKKQSKLLNN